jgi:hypothetical protein
MDLGSYMVLVMRQMLKSEPEDCIEAVPRLMPKGFDQKCDQAMKAKWTFPNGATGSIDADLSASGGYPLPWITSWLPTMDIPNATAVHREVVVEDDRLPAGQEHVSVKTVSMRNFIGPHYWHRIDIEEQHMIRKIDDKSVVKTWTEKSYRKAYTWEKDSANKGEEYWSTYRYQLEQFVNRIKGREGSGLWMDGEDSVNQMAVIDSAYEKAGLPLRPTSSFM